MTIEFIEELDDSANGTVRGTGKSRQPLPHEGEIFF